MLVEIGYAALIITFLVSVYGIWAAIYGERNKLPKWIDSARNAMLLTFPLLTISSLSIIMLLVNFNFEVDYVFSVTSRSMPTYLRVTALWGGQPGSLLFWSWLMSAFATAVTLRKWDRDREFLSWVIVVCLITLAFFLMLIIFFENPYIRSWVFSNGSEYKSVFQPSGGSAIIRSDGRGLNPLLRHPGMVIHPPMLYLGFVGFVIPYAFAIAALVTGRTDDRWIRLTRRWTIWSWLFLSIGLILGGRWAYDVLGWGGYWGWDPVEIAAFMPWLTATPFLHSVMIQEKRSMLKQWNMVLIILTYSLVIFGTFLTRSGVLSSVHAFAQSAIGPAFFIFIGITFIGSLVLLRVRWNGLQAKNHINSWFSREGLFLINNLLFIGILVICFWGVIFPLSSELFTGQKITVGPVFYERATGPLWYGLLFLMGIAPLSAWGASTAKSLGKNLWTPAILSLFVPAYFALKGIDYYIALLVIWLCAFVTFITLSEFYRGALARHRKGNENIFTAFWSLIKRDRRRYGGYIIHLAVVMMGIGIMGIEVFQTETQGTIPLGGELVLGDYSMTYDSLAEWDTLDNRRASRAVVSVYKKGEFITELYPRRDYFYESQQPMTIPGVRSTFEDDFYVLLVDWEPITVEKATFKIYHNPLVNLLWLGTIVLMTGSLIAAWPIKENIYLSQTSREIRADAKAVGD